MICTVSTFATAPRRFHDYPTNFSGVMRQRGDDRHVA